MKSSLYITVLCALSVPLLSQNDLDAIRYSQTFFGGTARSKAMAGSFGALGADGSAMAINPAGIGLYKKGDINIGLGLKFSTAKTMHNNSSFSTPASNATFDGLNIVGAWDGKIDPKSHHALGFSGNQLVNFNSEIYIEGNSNHKSITQDMLQLAKGVTPKNLDGSYEGLAFNTLALDTFDGKYYSFVDTKYNLKQANEIQKSGRINEWNINYAYGYDDKLYIGASLGISSINFNYQSTYTEVDDKDSMRVSATSSTYNYGVYYYKGFGGFKDLSYQETYRTSGTGVNLKLGAIYRATDFLRLGVSYATPTFYNLTDTYIYTMTTRFDEGDSYTEENPPTPGGKFKYKLVTPMKVTGSIALLFQKYGALNIDYDYLNYSAASLKSSPQVFSGVNNTIKQKYSATSNLRVGAEVALRPIYLRAGYAMYGSPFGDVFSGDGVRVFYTGGIGYRMNKFYIDLAVTQSVTNDTYYMYNSDFVDKSTINNSGTTIGITVGSKF
jgi:hypothetical protein